MSRTPSNQWRPVPDDNNKGGSIQQDRQTGQDAIGGETEPDLENEIHAKTRKTICDL